MDATTNKYTFKDIMKYLSTVISWTVFTLLIMVAILLVYYIISLQLYFHLGEKYAPKFSLYTIMSGSMVPNIGVHDVIINNRVDSPDELGINDVITFTSVSPETRGTTITHRIVSIINDEDGVSYVTKGDANPIQDTSPVPFENVIGKVALKIPLLGGIQVFVARRFGWLLLLLFPALCILLKEPVKKFVYKGVDVDNYVTDKIDDEVYKDDIPKMRNVLDENIDANVTIFTPDTSSKVSDNSYDDDLDLPELK